MADDRNPHDPRKLPWPEESDPSRLGGAFADPTQAEREQLGNAFADPNSLDDAIIGKSFEETNSSRKKKKPPVTERIHKPKNRRPIFIIVSVLVSLFALVVLVGWLMRRGDSNDAKRDADRQRTAKPVVQVVKVGPSRDQAGLTIPGTTIPLTEAYIYGRANGYLKTRLVDIGDRVKKDQLLAVIDAPDLDAQVDQARQQLRQSQQQLEQQKSQLALNTVTVERYRVLVAKGVLSRQDGDQQEANFRSQVANVAAAERNVQAFQANLDRQMALQKYEYVRAPFAGVITQRNVDVGALISAGGTSSGAQNGPAPQGQTSSTGGTQQAGQSNNAGTSGSVGTAATNAQSAGQGGPLYGIAQNERLRILVSVPEGFATAIHPGATAQLAFQEYTGATFSGQITRTANAIDPNTRTLLTEVQLDNHAGKFMPGMYVVVTFPPAAGETPPILVNGDAIVIRRDKPVVATVVGSRIRYVPVIIGRDFGSEVEILSGLKLGDLVINDVTDDVADGAEVQVKEAPASSRQPAPAPNQAVPPGGRSQYGNTGITDENMQNKQQQQNQKSTGQKPNAKQQSSSESKP